MGIETFVLEKGESLFINGTAGEIDNRLSELILSFSSNNPVAYGFLSIILVVLFGIAFSYIRELVHYIRYDLDRKRYDFFK